MAAPFAEFAGDKRLLWIASEWERYSDDLADWAMDRLVNRRDVWSQYTLRQGVVGVVMLPIKERRSAGTDMVTLKKLKRHFAGRAVSHLIGLHSISDHSTCKWFAIDVDLHDENVANADEIAASNFAACLEWAQRLRKMNFDPILVDSNGVGGFHLWVLLDKEYPLADVYDFVTSIRADHESFGLPRKPEVFPPKAHVEADDLPYGLRLPGRHHTRPHYTRVWNFDSIGQNDWLEGGEAIEVMLATRPAALKKTLIKTSTARSTKAASPKAAKKATEKRKPRICVDLDGVLAKYDGWKGPDQIGPPLPGAREFAESLAKLADIVIFTSRCSLDNGGESATTTLSPGALRIRVVEWLEENEIPFTDVYIGQGKPRAAAFIDDRAVPCRPQTDKTAFADALKAARSLVSKRIKDPGSEDSF